jgi:hypothetical protein
MPMMVGETMFQWFLAHLRVQRQLQQFQCSSKRKTEAVEVATLFKRTLFKFANSLFRHREALLAFLSVPIRYRTDLIQMRNIWIVCAYKLHLL